MKILLVKLNHIGDTLILTPTIALLRHQYPNAVIDVVIRQGCEGVLINNPHLTRIITVTRPEKKDRTLLSSLTNFFSTFKAVFMQRYDIAFDLSNSDRAKIILWLSGAKRKAMNDWHVSLETKHKMFTDFSHYAWGKEHQVCKDFYTVTDVMEIKAQPGPLILNTQSINTDFFTPFDLKNTGYVVVHPVSRWRFKEWDITRWQAVLSHLLSKGFRVILTCAPDKREIEVVKKIMYGFDEVESTFGHTDLPQLAVLIQYAKLFIGVDTVAMHMAAAVNTPVVALFGPSSEWSWHPWQVKQQLVFGECACKKTRQFICDKSKIYPCMESIQTTSIINAINKLLPMKYDL